MHLFAFRWWASGQEPIGGPGPPLGPDERPTDLLGFGLANGRHPPSRTPIPLQRSHLPMRLCIAGPEFQQSCFCGPLPPYRLRTSLDKDVGSERGSEVLGEILARDRVSKDGYSRHRTPFRVLATGDHTTLCRTLALCHLCKDCRDWGYGSLKIRKIRFKSN